MLYAAPEYFGQSDHRPSYLSDQFSASVVLYEMLTGELPFGGLGGKVGLAPQQGNLERPSECLRSTIVVPKSVLNLVDDLVRQGLAIDPNERFVKAGSWRRAVDNVWSTLGDAEKNGEPRFAAHPAVRKLLEWVGMFAK